MNSFHIVKNPCSFLPLLGSICLLSFCPGEADSASPMPLLEAKEARKQLADGKEKNEVLPLLPLLCLSCLFWEMPSASSCLATLRGRAREAGEAEAAQGNVAADLQPQEPGPARRQLRVHAHASRDNAGKYPIKTLGYSLLSRAPDYESGDMRHKPLIFIGMPEDVQAGGVYREGAK